MLETGFKNADTALPVSGKIYNILGIEKAPNKYLC
jgi:hypothetical protein